MQILIREKDIHVIIYNTNNAYHIIYRSNDKDSDYDVLGYAYDSQYNVTIYEDHEIVPGLKYYYKLRGETNDNYYARSDLTEAVESVPLTTAPSSTNEALAKAKLLLKEEPYSKIALIYYLKNMNYSDSDATYAVENCGANWNLQALRKAEYYATFKNDVSKNRYISDLENEYFTHEEAVYAANNVNVDWYNNALTLAIYYDRNPDWSDYYSRSSMINHIELNGFTHEESVYAADNCDANWNRNALLKARNLIRNNYSRSEVLYFLENDYLFTHEEAVYGTDNSGASWGNNALNRIKNYTASRLRIISYLTDYGFTESEINYAINNCNINWNNNAVINAKDYTGTSPYSRQSVINYLLDIEFTNEEAIYGVDHSNINWNNNAIVRASDIVNNYYGVNGVSRAQLISAMLDDKFTEEEAIYGVDNGNYNWKELAYKRALSYSYYYSISWGRDYIIQRLINNDEFTEEEALYADNKAYDWNEMAVELVESNLEYNYTKSNIINTLENYNYSDDEIEYAISQFIDEWKSQAVQEASIYLLSCPDATRDEVIEELIDLQFTNEEAIYGADNCGHNWE